MKLGAKMPDYDLSAEEIDALVAYLYTPDVMEAITEPWRA